MALRQQSGFSFPMIAAGPQGHLRYTTQNTVALLGFSIQQILLTMPGERWWNPSFGCNIRLYHFDALTQTAINTLKSLILEALQQWETRVTVIASGITITESGDPESNLLIQIAYSVNNPDFAPPSQLQNVSVTL